MWLSERSEFRHFPVLRDAQIMPTRSDGTRRAKSQRRLSFAYLSWRSKNGKWPPGSPAWLYEEQSFYISKPAQNLRKTDTKTPQKPRNNEDICIALDNSFYPNGNHHQAKKKCCRVGAARAVIISALFWWVAPLTIHINN